MLRRWHGARWLAAPGGRQLLLTDVVPAPGGTWHYVYSIAPGVRVTVVVVPSPVTLPADHPDVVDHVAELARRPQWPVDL